MIQTNSELADELERLYVAWSKPGSETSAAFALRSHLVAHVPEILTALRTSKSEALADDAVEQARDGLLALHRKMLLAVQRGRPYPVSIALGDDDTWAVLNGAIELERAALTRPEPLASPAPDGLAGELERRYRAWRDCTAKIIADSYRTELAECVYHNIDAILTALRSQAQHDLQAEKMREEALNEAIEAVRGRIAELTGDRRLDDELRYELNVAISRIGTLKSRAALVEGEG